ncbi:MAG: hypothetical protein HQ523_05665 [Lentisphaerae bacterium]|nr:hypothetical protein [Lentisphaerota bacterium]
MLKTLRFIVLLFAVVAWVALLIGFGVTGVSMIAADTGRSWDAGQSHNRRYIRLTREQLAAVSRHLRDYRKSHGRYPTNDEGLAVLDGFATRQKVFLYRPANSDQAQGYSFTRDGYEVDAFWFWSQGHSLIARFWSDHEHAPTTTDELLKSGLPQQFGVDLLAARGNAPVDDTPGIETVEWELAIGHDCLVFLISPGGIMSAWQVPFVYENRNDTGAGAFEDSPVDDDSDGQYSVKVDEGIHVWSVGAQQYADELDTLLSPGLVTGVIGVTAILLTLLLIWLTLSPTGRAVAIMGLAASSVIALATRVTISCYLPSNIAPQRSPEMVSRRQELLDKYHGAGAISKETYTKSLVAMGLKPSDSTIPRPEGADSKGVE